MDASPATSPLAVLASSTVRVLPAEQRGGLAEGLGDRPGADDDQLRDGPQHGDHAVLGDDRAADAASELRTTALAGRRDVSAVHSVGAHHLVAVEPGTRGRPARGPSAGPTGRRAGWYAGTTRQRAPPPAADPPRAASTSPTRRSTRRPLLLPRLATSASWSSRAPARSEPTRPPPGVRAERHRSRSAGLEPVGFDDPRHVHPGAGPQQAATVRAISYTPGAWKENRGCDRVTADRQS